VLMFHVAFSSREILVKRQIRFLLMACMTRNVVPSPAPGAILWRSARSIPMDRAGNGRTFMPFTTKLMSFLKVA
jgi:hypothetical protein